MVDHVNSITGWRWAPNRGSSITNCAACTAAGCFNLTIGTSEVSSGIVSAAHEGDAPITLGTDTKDQIRNIRKYVADKTGRKAEETSYEIPLAQAEQWMRGRPEKTVFAVLASGSVPYDNVTRCHWLNAILVGGLLRYFDFQPMRKSIRGGDFPGHRNPATCTKPFVGVVTQALSEENSRMLHQPNQPGVFDNDVRLTVIAFPPN